ncbi:uncharacterized protein AB675_2944 [Cyphellophora attinorum]|uniref:Uncharacterized protein n=1 Tax=Cyphellophora attinorum TaxID=1664694 RepID=A0A0N0NJ16_9EURO|nr:uncharacterized protein AB675_2944 [Phialophora attinorum]KPI36398.1 hypothetical protein AB675_2944 [Phialophora attinorum]
MSEAGPTETSAVTHDQPMSSPINTSLSRGAAASSVEIAPSSQHGAVPFRAGTRRDAAVQTAQRPVDLKMHFEEFAAQLRRHRHTEHKRRMLEHRKTHLHKAVALTGRLQRLSSWLHDGLVEISKSHNAVDFVRVHQHLLELTARCLGRWQFEIRSYDPLTSPSQHAHNVATSFLSRISPVARNDCLEFIRNVRSNPRFLADRFKAVHPSQLVALSTAPRYSDPAAYLSNLSPNRNRLSQRKRLTSYAKNLEDYANAFERKNAMAFLLHNCFGANSAAEDSLRLETWSSICATLYLDMGFPFLSFFHQILWEFAGLGIWRAKARLELFLMDILQRGAFLLEPVTDFKKGALDAYIADTLATDTAKEFFDQAVRELFSILADEDGGFPMGALQLVRTMLSKMPDERAQAEVRGWVISEWFLDVFLRTAITFPENQKMLLQSYISESARSTVLSHFWRQASATALAALQEPDKPDMDQMQRDIFAITNQLFAEPLPPPSQQVPVDDTAESCVISLCITDLIHVLEALSQQYTGAANHFEPFVHSLITQFNSQKYSPKLDRLRRELQLLVEPGLSSGTQDILQEEWLNLNVSTTGQLTTTVTTDEADFGTLESTYRYFEPLSPAERAAVRLALDQGRHESNFGAEHTSATAPLRDRFLSKASDARSTANMVDAHFWYGAVDHLDDRHHLSDTAQTEKRVLQRMFSRLRAVPVGKMIALEDRLSVLEIDLAGHQAKLEDIAKRLQHLKIKMWYTSDVVNSSEYESARNVSRALNYMSLAPQTGSDSSDMMSSKSGGRPGTSASAASSIFEQPKLDTMKILRAPPEHGGPKKLSDEQIEKTRGWLARNNIDNFCKGEERIHRFCMEVRALTRKLVAESANESPALWHSDLWARERNWFDVTAPVAATFPGHSGPPSIMSESPSFAAWSKPVFGSQPSSRSLDSDYPRRVPSIGHGSTRISQDVLGNDLTSSFIGGRRSNPISTTESVQTGFSSVASQPRSSRSITSTSGYSQPSSIFDSAYQSRSQTSASQSRPPSLFSEMHAPKLVETSVEKAQFLESLRDSLTVLLLSDLGNPVWSSGSETDAWLTAHKRTTGISQRLERRHMMSGLVEIKNGSQQPRQQPKQAPRQRRTWSSDDHFAAKVTSEADSVSAPANLGPDKLHELDQVLQKISRQVDPNAKLRAVYELHQLAMIFLGQCSTGAQRGAENAPRRQSLGAGSAALEKTKIAADGLSNHVRTDVEMRGWLKDVLLSLHPQTLFRDLQYIAAFASSDALNRASDGAALVQIGLAALASKDEICRIMVELADKIVTRDGIKRRSSTSDNEREYPLTKARDYWIIGAREGNAVAQRELAGLYLAHPEMSVTPAVTAPLALSGDVFRTDMMWQREQERQNEADLQQGVEIDSSQRALCLALHWMQLAAKAGDVVAQQRLEERKGKHAAMGAALA